MGFLAALAPTDSVDEKELDRGLNSLLLDGICSQVMVVLTSGAFLVAFALLLGASSKVIGLLAAVGPLAQILQIPSIFLIEKTRLRKALVVGSAFLSRLCWLAVAVLPWFVPEGARVAIFLVALLAYSGLGAISGCAWNSWMRDLIPERVMGGYFAKRMAYSIALGAVLSLVAGVGVDVYKSRFPDTEAGAYSLIFLIGAAAGLVGLWFLSRVPEPRMAVAPTGGILSVLSPPFRDKNFRRLLIFLGSWSFAVSLAAPFFTVYLLQRLGQPMTIVMGLAVLSQIVNVLFLRIWGRLADRFSNKSVLAVSGPMFLVSILLWPFTTMPDTHFLTIPLLIAIHVLAGISTAGVGLCGGNIALKSAPRGAATAYLATNALVCGLAATVAPVVAGFAADWFSSKELNMNLTWIARGNAVNQFSIPAMSLSGLDFLFIISFILGLYAMHRLLAVREEGEAEKGIVLNEFYAEVRRSVRSVSNISGMRRLVYFPFEKIRTVRRK